MEELGGKITEVFGNVSWNKESLGSGSVEVHQYHSADQYFILAKKKSRRINKGTLLTTMTGLGRFRNFREFGSPLFYLNHSRS